MAITAGPSLAAAGTLLAGTLMLGWQAGMVSAREVEAGFWFEDVQFRSPRLGGALTGDELTRAHDVAVAELHAAFSGLRIRVTGNRNTRYRVRVVQQVRDARMLKAIEVAGQSRGMSGFGGSGLVNFYLLASGAVAYAPDDLDRAGIIDAIGRGVGRSAAHEFAHQLLPHTDLHASRSRASYEYYAASRPEQYYGVIAWDVAGPLLRARLGAGDVRPRGGDSDRR